MCEVKTDAKEKLNQKSIFDMGLDTFSYSTNVLLKDLMSVFPCCE